MGGHGEKIGYCVWHDIGERFHITHWKSYDERWGRAGDKPCLKYQS